LKSLRLQLVKILSVSESFEDEEAIYFPHQMDFRGRAYAVPMFLNPQGSDLAKGMLTFANGVPIDD
jgi:DNA-directed RNA polymerase